MPTARTQFLLLACAALVPACFTPDPATNDTDTASSTTGDDSADASTTAPAVTDGPDTPEDDSAESTGGDVDDTSSTAGIDADSGSDGATDGVDESPPTVLDVAPNTGAAGVWADTTIVVTFSEPMDRVATQAAWQSADLGAVVMMWNADDTELTVVPNVPLAYASGTSDDAVVAADYTFTIDTTATDTAGNGLAEAYVSNFSTLRRIVLDISPVDIMTGMSGPTINSINVSNVYAGDTQFNALQRGMITFDLPVFPPGFEAIDSAVLSADQSYVGGSPYGGFPALGTVRAHDVAYATQFDAPEAASIADIGSFSDDGQLESKQLDVTDAVVADHDAQAPRTQYMLAFEVQTNADDVLDRVTFDKSSVALQLAYLTE